jgi:colanic acid/amylovoran biosynthesis protein
MTLVLTGVTGLRNRGVEALVRAAIDGFTRHLPGEPATVVTSDPRYDRLALEGVATVVPDAPGYFRSGRLERCVREVAAVLRSGKRTLPAIAALRSATAIVASGGDVFSSDYGALRRHLGIVKMAQALGRPTVFLAHSIGPFKTTSEARMMRGVLDRAALITVRERRTRDYLVGDLRVAPDRVQLTADVAFLLQPPPPARIDALKRWLGLSGSGYVALAPSEGITTFSSARDRQAHDHAWMRTIEYILETSNDDVLIVPHVQETRPAIDDRRIAGRLVEATGYNPRVRIALGEFSASDFKGLIRDSRYLVGERMHACIAALSTGVPTIAVGYSVKAQGIMEDLLGPRVSSDGLHVSVAQFVGAEGLRAGIETVTRSGDAIRKRLAATAAEAMRLAEANFVALRTVLDGRVKAAA